MNVSFAETILRAIFGEALGGVDHEDRFAPGCPFFVEQDNASRDARTVEEVGRQADDAFDEALLDEVTSNGRLGVATKEDAVRQDDCALAGGFEAGEDVKQEGVVTILFGWNPVGEAVVGISSSADSGGPRLRRERRVRDHVVERAEPSSLGVSELWGRECVVVLDLSGTSVVEPHVHSRESRSGVVHLLSVDG